MPAISRPAASRRRRVLTEVDYGDHTPAPADILRKLADAADAGAALESFNPPHRGFQALKAKLAELRAGPTKGGALVAETPARPAGRRERAQKVSVTVTPPSRARRSSA